VVAAGLGLGLLLQDEMIAIAMHDAILKTFIIFDFITLYFIDPPLTPPRRGIKFR
jgi:hypothetical protein